MATRPPPGWKRWALRPLLLVSLLALVACGRAHFVPDQSRGFYARETAGHKHHIYLPAGWSADRKWPVIVFLHGAGERGSDGIMPTLQGLGPYVWKSERTFPFIVVFPQSAPHQYWPYPQMERRVLESLDDVIAHYAGDPKRVYLTGISMGGYGTWIIAARNPGRFAALVPICGGIKVPPQVRVPEGTRKDIIEAEDPYAYVAHLLGKTPAWVFHGAMDPLVPPSESRKMVIALERAGTEARYTEYANTGHRSWDRAYAEPGLYDWLLAHHL